MSRYLFLSFAVLLVASVTGCETTKLQRDMLEDSTWETSAGRGGLERRGQTSESQREEAKRGVGEEERSHGGGASRRTVAAREQSRPAVSTSVRRCHRAQPSCCLSSTMASAAFSKMFRPSRRFTRAPSWASASSACFPVSPRSHRSTFVLVTPSRASTASQSSGRSRLLRSGKSCEPLPISSSTIGETGEAHALRFAIVDEG